MRQGLRRLTRRSVLVGACGALLPLRLGLCGESRPPRTVVVGAGLAGLVAAFELQQAGAEVRIIEQSRRVGGRVKTVRGEFADDAWVDVGGQRAGPGYASFFFYAQKFGLDFELQARDEPRPDVLLHLHGELYSLRDLAERPQAWPLSLADTEKPIAPLGLLRHYLRPIASRIVSPDRVLHADFVHYDELSLGQLLARQGASEAAIGLIEHSLNYNSLATVSALSALRDAARRLYFEGSGVVNLVDGNSRLPEAFARSLGERVHLGHRLRALEQDDSGVNLLVETGMGTETWRADRVVIAIPFTALRDVRFDSELPVERRRMIDELPYTQVLQTYVQTVERFWERGNPVSLVYSDGPLERLFDASAKLRGERGLLVNWINGTGVRTMAGGDAAAQAKQVRAELGRLWPGSERMIERVYTQNWGRSYVKGAYAHYAPGQMASFAAEIPRPVGRLHFAGEHTELVAPGMEGALRSGQRAAREVIDSGLAQAA